MMVEAIQVRGMTGRIPPGSFKAYSTVAGPAIVISVFSRVFIVLSSYMSNIHKRIRFVKLHDGPLVPMVHDDQKENRLQFLGENDRARFLKSEVMLICCFQKKKKREEKRKEKTGDLLEGSNGQKKKRAFCQAGKN